MTSAPRWRFSTRFYSDDVDGKTTLVQLEEDEAHLLSIIVAEVRIDVLLGAKIDPLASKKVGIDVKKEFKSALI